MLFAIFNVAIVQSDENSEDALPDSRWVVTPDPEAGKLEFKSFGSLVPDSEIKLDNGKPVDGRAWEAITSASFIDSNGKPGHCTATLIGPRVILTAAHCFESNPSTLDGSVVEFRGSRYSMTCQQHPHYVRAQPRPKPPRHDSDYALCKLDKGVDDVLYESIDIGTAPRKDMLITLTGYGCVNVSVGADKQLQYEPSSEVLRVGADNIYRTDYSIVTFSSGMNFLTRSDGEADPILCPGDSGGPAFLIDSYGRRIIAVNSAVAWIGTAEMARFFSSMAPLGGDAFNTFLANWQDANEGVQICGVDYSPGAFGCRGTDNPFDLSGEALY